MKIDYSLLVISIPVAIFVVRWFRIFLDTATHLPQWDRILKQVWLVAAVFLFIGAVFGIESDYLNELYIFSVSCAVVATFAKMQYYPPARTLLIASGPLVLYFAVMLLINGLFPSFSKHYNSVFDTAKLFVYIWGIAFVFVARNQKKNIEEDKLKQQAEAERIQRIETENMTLERLVDARTAELKGQTEELQQTLLHLQDAQKQLIHSEKMASLGELTAGIAHEIQNPLNFVNNFAEVSVEMIDELKEELAKPDIDTAYILTLADELSLSQEKIHHHGRRAASIVKGMLEHSRSNTGEKKPIDLNALADEYIRLAYHGLRAKDKAFNANIVTRFDPTITSIMAVGQDMGRVLLNLFNNAFYSVQQRALKSKEQGVDYQPEVTVTTKRLDNAVEIRVRDNGLGIPQAALDKIFQPFFTTKPTGEGTGLGLSISYDIITNGHGGTLMIDTAENEFAEFIITLPASADSM